MIISDIIREINNCRKFAITCHISADGDAMGSVLALTMGLRSIGKKVTILSKEKAPENYFFLPGINEIDIRKSDIDSDTDCVIVLDCGNIERINADIDINNRKYELINIDHHQSNDMYGDLNLVDSNSSAVGEIIYQLLMMMGIKITKEIADCLYVSIITDTGSFKYPSTTAVTHAIAGDLINTGIDFNKLHRITFENKKYEVIKLYGMAINSMKLTHSGKICTIELKKNMLSELNLPDNTDTSEIIALAMQIDSVEVCALLKEFDGLTKVSLRSKSIVDVSKVAANFSGGGHKRASGFAVNMNIEDVKTSLIEVIEKGLIS